MKKKMALDTVSRFFDSYRQKGQEGLEALQLIRENISKSIKESSLGDCKLQFDLALRIKTAYKNYVCKQGPVVY